MTLSEGKLLVRKVNSMSRANIKESIDFLLPGPFHPQFLPKLRRQAV
jgi:hypothetical protein